MQVIERFHTAINTPYTKDLVKRVLGDLPFALGILEAGLTLKDCFACSDVKDKQPKKVTPDISTTSKIVNFVTNTSIFLSTLSSRPGQYIGQRVCERLFAAEQLILYFGPNQNFEQTPRHPRHVISIAAFLLGIPATLKSFVVLAGYAKDNNETETRRRWIATWNTLTSRPALHLGNALVRKILAKA